MGSKKVIHVCGWLGCPWFQRASHLASTLQLLYPTKFESKLHESSIRDEYIAALPTHRASVQQAEKAVKHTACPFVYFEENAATNFIGGCDAVVAWAKSELGKELNVGGVTSVDDVEMLPDGFGGHSYDYDVVVIGGGSGGLATSKECARLGAKTAVLDFVKPSPAGTTWGLGGTCVNVGCIPKKLMHTASIVGSSIRDDAEAYGWSVEAKPAHSWGKMRENIQNYVKSLNFKYRVALREADVTYMNALGRLVDDHTVECVDKNGEKKRVTAARFVLAVGGRPTTLGCPGEEHAIDSDDVFSLEKAPGRTLCVGGGYVSMECGGFVAGLGHPVTCMVRSIPLRGFDRECVEKITKAMEHHGVKLQYGAVPKSIEKLPSGAFKVTDSMGGVNEYDTVFCAIGRTSDTTGLGLENVKGGSDCVDAKSKKVNCVNEQLKSAPHVYAIGDIVANAPELTPVAIEAGLRLAGRLFGDSKQAMDYEKVATTIFTPLEYGTIGLSEEDAKTAYGEKNLEIYISEFAPLEYALSETRSEDANCFAKVIVDKSNDQVIGFHYLGPNAGEITQGFAVAMRKKATYADLKSTVGIHPTVAEEFTTLAVTKASGVSAAKGGC